MSTQINLMEHHIERGREIARQLLKHVSPLIHQEQLSRNEVELALAYLLAESLSHRPEGIKELLTAQWQELIDPAAWADLQSCARQT